MYVPSFITDEDGVQYPVKSVGGSAFFGNPWLVAIYFDEGIEEILHATCAHCGNLESITLPSTLKTFKGSFEGCAKLQNFKLNEGLESIDGSFLYGVGLVTRVTIPASLKTITPSANGPTSGHFTGYDVVASNPYFKSVDGVLLSKDGTILYSVPTSLEWLSDYTTPPGVVTIYPGCFYKVYSLNTLTFRDGVIEATNTITDTRITTLNLPATLQQSPFSSYANGRMLQAINVTAGSQYLSSGDGILYNADKTEVLFVPAGRHFDTLTFPDTVKTIGYRAMSCVNINHFTFGKNVSMIRTRGIAECGRYNSTLTEAGQTCVLPASLTTLDPDGILLNCFFDQYSIDANNPAFMIQNNMLLSKDGTRLYAILLGRNLSIDTLVVPSTVTSCNARILSTIQRNIQTIDYSQTKITVLTSYTVAGSSDGFQVKLPDTLERLYGGATVYSNSMESLELPASVTLIVPSSIYASNLKELIFKNKGTFTANSIFGEISRSCVIRGYRGSSAEDVARQYTLMFEPLD